MGVKLKTKIIYKNCIPMCKYNIRNSITYLNGICLVFHLMGGILDKRLGQLNNSRTHLLFDPIFVQQIFLQHNHDRNACFAANLRRVKFNKIALIMNYEFITPIKWFSSSGLCNLNIVFVLSQRVA